MKRLLCSLSIVLFFPVIQYAKPVEMEIYAKVDQAVGNIAYTYKGELVYSNHPFYAPKMRVMHYDAKTKKATPYPNLAWNTPRKSDDLWFDSVLGIRSDSKGVIWILDMGQREGLTPKIVGWNTHTDSLEQIYYIPKPAS
ncbi:MAG: major royal jelly family protein, partial [Sulfurovum sp.]|nr:major royal jelly family protein [Sulfurovum sp.]MCB4755323.1 major royal jelly family protein [Sulfurovum sp.]MCB4762111.1 major royal jelly family protein [Sulfurovum sp.]MCB4773493.1 major royal jelly family protein [Sulfurovum sp.]MCB4781043.1 major royal jelly family protein [Sulfurovum sp.]